MSDVDELVEFLRERIAEEQAVAREAGGDVWTVYCPYVPVMAGDDPEDSIRHLAGPSHADEASIADSKGDAVVYDEGSPSPRQARHIARHDPARVLRECEAHLRIVEHYTKEQWVISQGHRTEWTEGGQAARETALRLLTTIYADHPDFRDEWKP